jgi:hypothetical protein
MRENIINAIIVGIDLTTADHDMVVGSMAWKTSQTLSSQKMDAAPWPQSPESLSLQFASGGKKYSSFGDMPHNHRMAPNEK